MLTDSLDYFIYGMCVMFYSMMVWMFWRKGKDTLPQLIMWIMLLQDLECFKDLFFFAYDDQLHLGWHLMTSVDMVIIPFYVFVLMELCKPGWFSFKKLGLHELPFVALPILFFCTDKSIWYDMLIGCHLWYGYARAHLLLHLSISSPVEGAILLSGEYQPQLVARHPCHLLGHFAHLDIQ